MAEEHGYQRSGKKCKEKFENLYKYYKKTKEGKAGRQDGKHYRFFRQLEAIYGDQSSNQASSSLLDTQFLGRNSSLLYDHQGNTNRPTNMNHESLSFSINSTEFETSSSENNEDDLSAIAFNMSNRTPSSTTRITDDQRMKGVAGVHGKAGLSSSWKAKVEGFVDSQMKKIMATQESWMEKMLRSVIGKEEERLAKEDEFRRQEAARFDQEVTEFWAKERAWVEARDAALMGALKNLRAKESSLELPCFPERVVGAARDQFDARRSYSSTNNSYQRWSEEEVSSLIELRTLIEDSFNHNNSGIIWEEIASKMGCLGYCRTANECREKWESVSLYVTMTSECKKKRREDYFKASGYNNYFDGQPLDQEGNDVITTNNNNNNNTNNTNNNVMGLQLMDEGLNSSSTSNVGTSNQMNPNNFFHLLFGEGENLWEKYGSLKLGKDNTNQH